MDVRGTPDRQLANNHLSQVRDQIRIESGEGTPKPSGAQLVPHTGDPELGNLLQELRALPDVREEAVQTANEKLQDGTYSSRQSAEEAADAILQMFEAE